MAFLYNRQHRLIKNRKGFTLIEILIVLTLSAFLFALSAPFSQKVQARMNLERTLKELQTDIQTTLNHTVSGKSIAILSIDEEENSPLPAYYGLYFEVDKTFGEPKGYVYTEFGSQENKDHSFEQLTTLITQQKALTNDSVFLKEIRIKNQQNSRAVKNVWLFFLSPFGKTYILEGSEELLNPSNTRVNVETLLKENESNEILEMDFQYKDDPKSLVTLSFGTDKLLKEVNREL